MVPSRMSPSTLHPTTSPTAKMIKLASPRQPEGLTIPETEPKNPYTAFLDQLERFLSLKSMSYRSLRRVLITILSMISNFRLIWRS